MLSDAYDYNDVMVKVPSTADASGSTPRRIVFVPAPAFVCVTVSVMVLVPVTMDAASARPECPYSDCAIDVAAIVE